MGPPLAMPRHHRALALAEQEGGQEEVQLEQQERQEQQQEQQE